MSALRRPFREAAWVCGVSLVLAFTYNGLSGKGIFDASPIRAASSDALSTPSTPSATIIPLEAAKSLFDEDRALFVDSRHAYDFHLGHISGAMNIPLKEAPASVKNISVSKQRTIVVYCDGAECNSSLEVGAAFVSNGFTDVRIFFGGWQSWRSAGFPSESDPS